MAVYAMATVAMAGVLVVNHGARDAAATVVLFVVLILSLPRWDVAIHRLLLLDLAVSMVVWWLYGPISGAAMITLAVVAAAPLLLDTKTARLLLVVALMTVPLEMAFHFLAGVVDLPLFHPPDPVPTLEFVVGELIKAGLLVGVGVLMTSVAEMLRRGRRALEADLERERELSRLKDRFVAAVSHELRTPLTSLKGFTRTLLDEDVGPDDRIEFLEIMADQAEELHGRIEDLITFSRIGAGGVTIRPLPVQLSLLASQSIGELGAVAEGVVENRVPRELLVWVDPPRIKQVLRNLLNNTIDYGSAPVVVTAFESESIIHCQVLDSGTGIPAEDAERVFERYSRLVDDSTMSKPGLGLGLPIVREVVAAHDGTVRIVSVGDAKGVEFTVPSVPTGAVLADELSYVGRAR